MKVSVRTLDPLEFCLYFICGLFVHKTEGWQSLELCCTRARAQVILIWRATRLREKAKGT